MFSHLDRKDDNVQQTNDYFTFIRAVGIIGIFSWHYYGIIHASRFSKPITETFAGASRAGDYLWSVTQVLLGVGGEFMPEMFVIASGYGLYLSYINKRPTWTAFIKRRALRILPLYYMTVLIMFFFVLKEDGTLKGFVYHLLMVHTFTEYSIEYGTLWFIGYIIQLYILFPFIVKAFNHDRIKWLLFISSFFMSSAAHYLLARNGMSYREILPTDYLPLFIFGMLLAESRFRGGKLHALLLNPSASLVSLVVVTLTSLTLFNPFSLGKPMNNFFSILIFLNMYILFCLIGNGKITRKLISLIGYSSYVIILFHMGIYIKVLEFGLEKNYMDGDIIDGMLYVTSNGLSNALGVIIFLIVFLVSYATQKTYDKVIHKLRL
jgi:peptidoglycan/LPS O-acetylase OafA/YrhL